MKRFISSWFIRGICLLLFLRLVAPAATAEFWVSPDGNDNHSGTAAQPLATVAAALRRTHDLRRLGKIATREPVQITLRGGIYPLTRPLLLRPEDSGTASRPTLIAAATNETPVLSGGVEITGWKLARGKISGLPAVASGKIWTANVPKLEGRSLEFRQLWVSGRKAVRARTPNGEILDRLVAWDKTNQDATIPAAALDGVRKAAHLEMVIDQVWEIAVLRVNTIRIRGTNALLTFKQPEGKIEFQHPWPPVVVTAKYQAPFYLADAIQFLDSPGEWFEDLAAGKIYYWPRNGEDLTRDNVWAPALESVAQIEGAPDQPVSNIQFKGITFAYTTWLRPSEQGHVPLQAGMFMLQAKQLSPRGTAYHPKLDNVAWIGRPPAAVNVSGADHITFERCRFEHLASAGLDFADGSRDDRVEGCVFRDIGGNGIQLGKFSDTNVETHFPYNPPDQREICSKIKISNNVVTGCGAEDWGCAGIAVGYAQNISIEHNDVSDLPYTGISVGWGWTKMTNALRDNFIFANRIHDVGQQLGDLGGIYLLSAQPGTVVAENAISDIQPGPYVPDPNHWFYLYLDEGSSFITVRDNWCPSEKFLKNANGPGNVWTNNGPQVSGEIQNAAGLEPAYRSLLSP